MLSSPSLSLVILSGEASTAVQANTRHDILSLTVMVDPDAEENVIVEVSPDGVEFFQLFSGGVAIEIGPGTAAHLTEVATNYIRFSLETGVAGADRDVFVCANRDSRSV